MLQNKEATFAPPIAQGGVNELETNRDLYEQHDMEACVWLFSNRKRGLRFFSSSRPNTITTALFHIVEHTMMRPKTK